jgi:hypothetical protein
MLWLLRKTLIPALAVLLGMWLQSGFSRDACLDAGGQWLRGVCHGARP